MRHFSGLLKQFAKDERGVFAVLFGLMAIVLIALGGAVVDYVSLEQTRARAQTALDAAALALQSEINDTTVSEESIRARAEAIVLERIGDSRVSAQIDRIQIDRQAGRLSLSGSLSMPTVFVGLVGVNELASQMSSEVVRGSVDIEVAVALDVTGSMDGNDIRDLRTSVQTLVNEIVQTDQTLNYSKVALVPYSQAVNAGTFATALRGPIRSSQGITNVSWLDTSTTRTITGITRANPGVVTSAGHGYANDEWVYIWGVNGMTQVNGRAFQVANRSANSFQLRGVSSAGYSSYTSGGSIRRCQYAGCQLEITSNSHGYLVNDNIYITNVGGITGINNLVHPVVARTANTLRIAVPVMAGSNYTANSGLIHCTVQTTAQGCPYFYFQSPNGNYNTFPVTTCVTERAANGTTDLAPTTTFMGRNYPPSGNPCLVNPIVPLTANRTTLTNAINALTAAGSTSGSMGILMTWYMLSPNFGYIWPSGSQPAVYRRDNLLKAAVIMTDGEFNTVHCQGAVARNSTSGSGSTSDHINCSAPNGDPYPQARAYCDAMKAQGVRVFTVGFAITAGSAAATMLRYCATTEGDYHLASSGSQMIAAFRQIAEQISALRVTQ